MESTPEPLLPSQKDLAGVIGMACRVAGASCPAELWKVIDELQELQTEIPKDRFNIDAFHHDVASIKGRTNTKKAYFLEQSIRAFDAGFFNVSRKEAEAMDPQQRLILEVVYEALEDAGLSLGSVSGSAISVYCGSSTDDYSTVSASDIEDYPTYANTGTGPCMMANRVSYFYNLKGESIVINTACSSSLVCLHLANESIRSSCSNMAIVIGSSVLLEPKPFTTMSDFGMLSTEGFSRTFDESAQGFARGEGVCALILKRVCNAEIDGDTIKAVIRGSSTNHDGAKAGLTVPSSDAQVALIQRAYIRAGISTRGTAFIEAHGTGTPVGDPIEADAIRRIFGSDGRTEPVYVGSVKTIIGHLEGAAGLISVIKMVMCVRNGKILGNKHFGRPHPSVKTGAGGMIVPTHTLPWPKSFSFRRASVNSFGYGGSNAHCIIEEYSPKTLPEVDHVQSPVYPSDNYLIVLSSHSKSGGAKLAHKLLQYVGNSSNMSLARFCHTLSTRRTFHAYRAFFLAKSQEDLVIELTKLLYEDKWRARSDSPPRLGFIFTGQGAQWPTMGAQLFRHIRVFKDAIQRCQDVLDSLIIDAPKWSISDELRAEDRESNVGNGEYSQTLCTALQIGLVEVFKSWGIKPDATVGHSSGEIGAAYASGYLCLEHAMIAAYYRGFHTSPRRTKGRLDVRGAMVAVKMTHEESRNAIKEFKGCIDIAAVNSPNFTTLSGNADAISQLAKDLTRNGVFNRLLVVDRAYHSHHMHFSIQPYYQALCEYQCGEIQLSGCKIPMFSSLTGRKIEDGEISAKYLADNLVKPVRFKDALFEMLICADETPRVDALIEIGPYGFLRSSCIDTMKCQQKELPYFGALSKLTNDHTALLSLVGHLFILGYHPDFPKITFAAHSTSSMPTDMAYRLDDLPTYAWDHEEYWYESRMTATLLRRSCHNSLLGTLLGCSTSFCKSWRNFLRLRDLPWLLDHQIQNTVILPASGFVSVVAEAILSQEELRKTCKNLLLEDVSMDAALVIPGDDRGVETIFQLSPLDGSGPSKHLTYNFCFTSFAPQTNEGRKLCSGRITVNAPALAHTDEVGFQSDHGALEQFMLAPELYNRFSASGIEYGPEFRLIEGKIRFTNGFASATIRYEGDNQSACLQDHYFVNPMFLDAALHPLLATIPTGSQRLSDRPAIPNFFGSIYFSDSFLNPIPGTQPPSLRVSSRSSVEGEDNVRADVVLSDDMGVPYASVRGIDLKRIGPKSDKSSPRSTFSKIRWQPAFSLLALPSTSSTCHPRTMFLAVDTFCHEFPKCQILLIPQDPLGDLQSLLDRTGGWSPLTRRFSQVTILVPVGYENISQKMNTSAIIEITEIPKKRFDLVLVLSVINQGLHLVIKEGGFLIAKAGLLPSTIKEYHPHLVLHFECVDFKCFRVQENRISSAAEPPAYCLIHSDRQMALVNAIRDLTAYSAADCKLLNFHSIHYGTQLKDSTVVVLISLHDDLLWEDGIPLEKEAYRQIFTSIKCILLSEARTIVWILSGALLNASKPQQAMILGMLRVARNENLTSRIVTFDIGPAIETHLLLHLIENVLFHGEDEYALQDQTIYIPRLVADEKLNIGFTSLGSSAPCTNGLMKRIVTSNDQLSSIHTARWRSTLASEACYLLVGGFGGLGRTIALWLAHRGARHIAIFSRSGCSSTMASDAVEELERLSVKVEVIKGDVTDRESLSTGIEHLLDNLRGVFHMAMVLKDNPLSTMSLKLWLSCVAPKVKGILNLDSITQRCNLDFFIGFSSTSAILGPRSQANYAAGNCFLDSFLQVRRKRGLPGTSLNIGMVTDIGLISENPQLRRKMELLGFDPIRTTELLLQLDNAIVEGSSLELMDASGFNLHCSISGAAVTSPQVFSYQRSICRCLSATLDNFHGDMSEEEMVNLTDELDFGVAENGDQQTRNLLSILRSTISTLTGNSVESIDISQTFVSYGIDSMSALDIRAAIRKLTSVEIAIFEVLGASTIYEVATRASSRYMSTKPKLIESYEHGDARLPGYPVTHKVVPIPLQYRHIPRPLSPYQRLFSRPTKGAVVSSFRLSGHLQPPRLFDALIELVKRNEILRTKFEFDPRYQQVCRGHLNDPVTLRKLWYYEDLYATDEDLSRGDNINGIAQTQIDALQRWTFEPESGLSIRMSLLRVIPWSFILTIASHIMITDSGMPSRLFQQLSTIYDGLARDQDLDALVPDNFQHIDLSAWYDNRLNTSKSQIEFWTNYIGSVGFPRIRSPFRTGIETQCAPAFGSHSATLCATMLTRMRRLCKQLEVERSDFLIALLSICFRDITDQKPPIIYVQDTKLPTPEIRNAIGFFHNFLPFRCPATITDDSFEDLVLKVKRDMVGVQAHHGITLAQISEVLGVEKNFLLPRGSLSLSYNAVKQSSSRSWETKDFEATLLRRPSTPMETDLKIVADEADTGELEITLFYRCDLYQGTSLVTLTERFTDSLESTIRDHRQPVKKVVDDYLHQFGSMELDNTSEASSQSFYATTDGILTPPGEIDDKNGRI